MVKKGFYFTMDALFASVLIVAVIVIFLKYDVHESEAPSIESLSMDVGSVLDELKIGEINSSWIQEMIANGTISDADKSVLSMLGEFRVTNHTTNRSYSHELLASLVLEDVLSNRFGVGIFMEGYDEPLYIQNNSGDTLVVSFKKMISGIKKDAPVVGGSSSAYIRKIADLTRSSYAYFGGFVGQGDLTVFLQIPANASIVESIVVELDASSEFLLEINGQQCNSSLVTEEFTPSVMNMTPDLWVLNHCLDLINNGLNNFSLLFNSGINSSYVGGGYIRVDYRTLDFQDTSLSGTKKIDLPAIDGFINLYDSISVKGTLNSMSIYLDYFINTSLGNATFFMSVGEDVVFASENATGIVNLSNTYISNILNYADFSNKTIPIRLGVTNISGSIVTTYGEPADTVLVTDVSGSMADCGEYSTPYICNYYCLWPGWKFCGVDSPSSCTGNVCGGSCFFNFNNHYLDCEQSRIEIAKESDELAVDIMLNASGTRVGLVSYNSNVVSYVDLTANQLVLNSEISNYTANGGTCVCCGIYRAFDLLSADSTQDYIIVMSDGDANYVCSGPGDYTGTYDLSNAPASTIAAGRYACNNSVNNVSVFTIGFGGDISPQGTATLIQTACNSSMYYNATNVSQLSAIYANITNSILQISNYSSQMVIFEGSALESSLNPASAIYLDYSGTSSSQPNEISLTMQTDHFGSCNKTINILPGLRVVDARLTSYSSEHWTDLILVNDIVVFNLSDFSDSYQFLGDPFIVEVPVDYLVSGDNFIFMRTGDNTTTPAGCSLNNSLIYSVMINSSTSRSGVLENREGCKWEVEFEDDDLINMSIPSGYAGSKRCYYTSTNISYDTADAYDVGMFSLLDQLDFDDDGRVFLKFDDIEIVINIISGVPYLWGPSLIEVRTWI